MQSDAVMPHTATNDVKAILLRWQITATSGSADSAQRTANGEIIADTEPGCAVAKKSFQLRM
eukprot:6178544-Pleurochrysis_carterae.AAC.3